MKALSGVLVVLVLFGVAAGNTASALEAPKQAVVSQATGTQAASEGTQVTVRVPLFAPFAAEVPLALVNDEPITLGELKDALAAAHEDRAASKDHAGTVEYRKILDRLIDARLIVQEARRIGFDELPAFDSAVKEFSAQAQGALLREEVTKDVKDPDPAAVEKRYKELVVEWKLKSLFFEKEDDAKAMVEAIKSGKSFEELAEKAVADKKAKGLEEGAYVRPEKLANYVADTISSMGTGSVSPVLRVQSGKTKGFTVIKLEDQRYPENPQAREQAEAFVLNAKKSAVWEEYKASLAKKNVKIREKFLKDLDLDSPKADFPKLLKDTRTVAEIKGEKPITVADLMKSLQQKHFHGLEQAAKSKKLNKDKRGALFAVISKRLIDKAVAERGIAENDEFQKQLKDFKNSTLFEMFLTKVVFPDVKVTEEDLKAYYEAHKNEYQFPEMMKMTSLAFGNKSDAESALAKLKKGSDLAWVRSNAEGLVVKDDDEDFLSLNNSVLSTKALPPDLAKAVAGAHAGEYRLYEDREKRFHVLSIEDIIPARPQPYEEVRDGISKKAFNEKLMKSVEDWFARLRAASTVKLYILDTGR